MLPGGLALEDGRVLRRALLRQLSGREEEWLASSAAERAALIATRLLGACLLDLEGEPGCPALARRLLVGDRDFLLLQLRRLTFGPHVAAVFRCPACDAKMDAEFSLDEVTVEARPQALLYHLPVEQERGPPREVRFRLPTGADQEAVLELPAAEAAEALFERCLVAPPPDALTPEQRAAVADAIERHAPQLDLELGLSCPECGQSFTAPFDLTLYFLGEMRATSQHLLREIHSLALYYHWSEAEILGLTRARRRAYLSLLSEATRRE
jgi:hypothetical protein